MDAHYGCRLMPQFPYLSHTNRVSRDQIEVSVKMSRGEMGGRVVIEHGIQAPRVVPFTLGPLQGKAYVKASNELQSDYDSLVLSFDLELIPDKELTLAEALFEFFGAEIQTPLPASTEEGTS